MRPTYEIPEPVAKLIALFAQNLAGVKFPGADAAVLEQAAEAARAAAGRLAEAETVMDAARAALKDAEDELVHKAQRALAYARIYAEESPALLAQLEPIAIGRTAEVEPAAGGSPEPRKRGRPRKVPGATPLFALREASPAAREAQIETETEAHEAAAEDATGSAVDADAPGAAVDALG